MTTRAPRARWSTDSRSSAASTASPHDLAQEDAADQVWIALPLRAEDRIREVLDALRQTTAVVRFVPDIQSFHLLHHSVTEVVGLPVLNLTDSPHTGIDSTLKTLEDLRARQRSCCVADACRSGSRSRSA